MIGRCRRRIGSEGVLRHMAGRAGLSAGGRKCGIDEDLLTELPRNRQATRCARSAMLRGVAAAGAGATIRPAATASRQSRRGDQPDPPRGGTLRCVTHPVSARHVSYLPTHRRGSRAFMPATLCRDKLLRMIRIRNNSSLGRGKQFPFNQCGGLNCPALASNHCMNISGLQRTGDVTWETAVTGDGAPTHCRPQQPVL